MISWESFQWREGDGSLECWFTTDALDVGTWERNEYSLLTTANVATFERCATSATCKDEYGGLYVQPDLLTQDELEMLAAIETESVLNEHDYSAIEFRWNWDEVDRWVAAQTAKAMGWDYLELDWKQTACFHKAIVAVMGEYSHWESHGLYVDIENAAYQKAVKEKTHTLWVEFDSNAAEIMDGYMLI